MASEVTLSASARDNLLSLQNTSKMISKTQEKLSTGKKVNSAIDDAMAFFKSRDLNNRATDLNSVKDNLSQSISMIKTATGGLESIESVLKQMKAIGEAAKATSDTTVRMQYASQYVELRSQIDNIANDTSFNGVNLLKSSPDNMTVKFNEAGTNSLQVLGQNSTAAGLSVASASSGSAGGGATAVGGWAQSTTTTANSVIDSALSSIDSALTSVRSRASTFGTNASMLTIRQDFTANLVNTLKGGAANLVNADMNEEGANMLSLQTRQQLGTISLSIAQQSEQAVLRLF